MPELLTKGLPLLIEALEKVLGRPLDQTYTQVLTRIT